MRATTDPRSDPKVGAPDRFTTSTAALATALTLSQHVLIANPDELASQLIGRLTFASDEVSWLRLPSKIWLRPLLGSLAGPDQVRGVVLSGHRSRVSSLAVHPDGCFLASTSGDQTVRVWDLDRPSEHVVLPIEAGPPRAITVSPDGTLLAFGVGSEIQVWDWRSASLRLALSCPDAVIELAWSPDGERLASACEETTLLLWRLKHGPSHHELVGHTGRMTGLAFTPDGRRLLSTSRDRTLRLWDARRGTEAGVLTGKWPLYALAVSPDGRLAVAGSEWVPIVWDLDSLEQRAILTGFYGPFHPDSDVTAVAFTPNQEHVISVGSESIRVWDINAQYPLRGSAEPAVWSVPRVGSLAVIPDGAWVACANSETIQLLKLQGGGNEPVSTSHGAPVKWIGFGPRGEVLWATNEYEDTDDGPEFRSALRGDGPSRDWSFEIRSIRLSDDLSTLEVSVGSGGESIPLGKPRSTESSAVGPLLDSDREEVRWFYPEDFRKSYRATGVAAAMVSKRGGVVAKGTGSDLLVLPDGTVKTAGVYHTDIRRNPVPTFSLARTAPIMATCRAATVALWDLTRNAQMASFTIDDEIEACALSGDGRTLVLGTVNGEIHRLTVEGADWA